MMSIIVERQGRTRHGWVRLVSMIAAALVAGGLDQPPLVRATDAQVPWECSNYAGDAQTRCMQALIETQREQIGRLQGELNAQQSAIGQLKDQVDRQSAVTADLQRQSSHPPTIVQPVAPMYADPPAGLGLYPGFNLYIGRPWGYRYGAYFGYRPYVGYGYPFSWRCRGHWRGCW